MTEPGRHRVHDDTGEIDRVPAMTEMLPPKDRPKRGQHRAPQSGRALAGGILGLCFLPFSWLLFGGPSIISLYLSWTGWDECEEGKDGKGWAIVGILTSVIGLGAGLLTLLGVLFW